MLRTLVAPALAVVVAIAMTAAPGNAAQPQTEAAQEAVNYIYSLQNDDAGFPAFGEDSAAGSTIDAIFALVSADAGLPLVNKGASPIDYLQSQATEYATDPGAAAKLALGLSAADTGADLSAFGGVDLLGVMSDAVDPATGAYGLDTFDEVLYVLALTRAGVGAPPITVEHLMSLQNTDGGWPFFTDDDSDGNTTAIALQAIIGAGVSPDSNIVAAGLDYLALTQNADGGFGFATGQDSDANSTSFAVQALTAAGIDADAQGAWAPGGVTPLDALLTYQNPATGAFQFFGEDSPFATYQAVPGLMIAPFPELEPLPIDDDEEPTPTAVDEPTPVVVTATPQAVVLPPSGGAGAGSSDGWIGGALAAVGAASLAGGALLWRRR